MSKKQKIVISSTNLHKYITEKDKDVLKAAEFKSNLYKEPQFFLDVQKEIIFKYNKILKTSKKENEYFENISKSILIIIVIAFFIFIRKE